jgi:hypothetical protein
MSPEHPSVTIAVRSQGDGMPALRVERVDAGLAGGMSVRVDRHAVVVTVGTSAVVETSERIDANGRPIARVTLRDGPLEIAIAGAAAPTTTCATSQRLEPVSHRVPLLPPSPRTAAVQDAEWQPIDPGVQVRPAVSTKFELEVSPAPAASPFAAASAPAGPPFVWDDAPGEIPTRIGRFDEARGFVPTHDVAAPAPAPARAPRIRPGVRRFALLAMLVATFMLWLHAQRARSSHHRATPRPTASATAAGPASSVRAAGPTPETLAPLPPFDISAPSGPPGADMNADMKEASGRANTGERDVTSPPVTASKATSRARKAADALATGAFADALSLYDALAAEPGANPAYARIARSLRSRSVQNPQ